MHLLATNAPETLNQFRHPLSRKGATTIVGALDTCWESLADAKPELIVLDLALCGPEWKAMIAKTRIMAPATRMLVAAKEFSTDHELSLLGMGVAACCGARLPPESIARIIDMVLDGGVWISHAVLPLLLKQLSAKAVVPQQQVVKPVPAKFSELTPREREIAQLVGSGASNKLIARELQITDRTVKAHLSAIFQKLGMRDRVRLALYINGRAEQSSGQPVSI